MSKLTSKSLIQNMVRLSCILFLTKCSSLRTYRVDPQLPKSNLSQIQKKVVIAKDNGYKVTINEIPLRERFETPCYFASIPGAFYGAPTKPYFNNYKISETQAEIQLSEEVFDKQLIIAKFREFTPVPGHELSITPVDLQFSRVATLCRNFAVGFTDDKSNMLSLMYFDGAGKITGQLRGENGKSEVDLTIPEAGFYFVVQEASSPKTARINRWYTGQVVNFAVFKAH